MLRQAMRAVWIAIVATMQASALFGQSLTITTNGNLGTFVIGQGQLALNASGGTGSYTWSLASGSLPPGLNIANLPGQSTPQAGLVGVLSAVGNYSFSLKVSDGQNSVTQPFTMKVTALLIKDINLPDAFTNDSYSYTFTPLNNAGPVTFEPTSLPSGLSLSSQGVLSGSISTPGTYNINFSISDGVDTVFRGMQLTVYAVDLTTPGLLPNAAVNSFYSATLSAP